MPLYEYVCEKDGTVIELIRPADRADDPVPDDKGRTFKRRLSVFAPRAGASTAGNGEAWCPCGKRRGGCGERM
jgi:hypothetical protein